MWDDIQDLRTVELEVREPLNGAERDWVIGRLLDLNGVNGALWRGAHPRVSIEYDADVIGGIELVDRLESFGLHVRPARHALTPLASAVPVCSAA